ncbi:MAG: type III secretion system inner membrane ring lipoprotein SctJ [Chlamydiota bacterium]
MMVKQLSKALNPCIKAMLFMILAVSLTACQKQETIINSVPEREANEIIVYLAGKDIEANKVRADEGATGGGTQTEVLWDIKVPPNQSTAAMAMLNLAGLPRKKSPSMLEIFKKGGLVSSESEEKIRYQAGLAEQIANTIRKIDGVIDADIQLSFPTKNSFEQSDDSKVSASVYVKHTGVIDDPNAHLVTKIKRLVASGINDLEFENVTVISDKARFTDYNMADYEGDSIGEERDYVKIWSVVISKDSASHFRTIFFSLWAIILLLILLLAGCLWKFYHIIQQVGGWKSLISLQPLTLSTSSPKEKTAKSAKPPNKVKKSPPPKEEEEDEEEEEEE